MDQVMNKNRPLYIYCPPWEACICLGWLHHLKSEKQIYHKAVVFIFYILKHKCLHSTENKSHNVSFFFSYQKSVHVDHIANNYDSLQCISYGLLPYRSRHKPHCNSWQSPHFPIWWDCSKILCVATPELQFLHYNHLPFSRLWLNYPHVAPLN